MVAHAAENSGLKDTLFIIGEMKELSGDYYKIFDWINQMTERHLLASTPRIYLRTTSESIETTADVKLKLPVVLFGDDATKGISELNWFFLPRTTDNPFNEGEKAAGIYFLKQSEEDLLSARQESVMWKFNEKGEPQAYGGVIMDCARMIASDFKTMATSLTTDEKIAERLEEKIPASYLEQVIQSNDTRRVNAAITGAWMTQSNIKREFEEEENEIPSYLSIE